MLYKLISQWKLYELDNPILHNESGTMDWYVETKDYNSYATE